MNEAVLEKVHYGMIKTLVIVPWEMIGMTGSLPGQMKAIDPPHEKTGQQALKDIYKQILSFLRFCTRKKINTINSLWKFHTTFILTVA